MIHLGCNVYAKEGNNIWFSNISFNGLFKMDLENGQIEFIHRFEEIACNKGIVWTQMFKEGDELIFVPWVSDSLVIYNIKTCEEYHIPFLEEKKECEFGRLAFRYKDVIWLFPAKSGGKVLCYDIKNKVIVRNDKLGNWLLSIAKGEVCTLRGSIYNDKITLCLDDKNILCQIELETMDLNANIISESCGNIYVATFDGCDYWLLQKNSSNIYQWNAKDDVYIEYIAEYNEEVIIPYTEIKFFDKDPILVNYYGTYVCKVNKQTRTVNKLFEYPEGFAVIKNVLHGATFLDAILWENNICFIPQRGSMVLYYNLKDGTIRGKDFVISKQDITYLEEIINENFKTEEIREIGEINTLKNYINHLQYNEAKENFKTNIGEFIHKEVNR